MKEKRLTINEIAQRAGTSKTTVSFYLNNKFDKMSKETRDRIETVIKETNYQPSVAARSLNAKSTRLIGVIIGDITNSFSNQIVKGIDELARQKQYQIIVGNSNYQTENEALYIERMLSMGVDGFIVQPTAGFEDFNERLKKAKKELVFVDSRLPQTEGKWVKTNNYEATYETTLQCIEKGYESFLMITADPTRISTRKERASGYTDALSSKGKTCETYILEEDVVAEEVRNFVIKQIQLDKKTLLFVPNCWALPKVFLALRQYRHLIPDTIGILGFDNLEWTTFSSPGVTTIVQPAYEEGQKAAEILIDALEATCKQSPTMNLPCTVNWHESTALD